MTKTRKHRHDHLLPDVRGELNKWAGRIEARFQSMRRSGPLLPADVGKYLQEVMLARENVLEDARYLKVVPNDFVVELNEDNYHRRYRPAEKLISEQWRGKLLDVINTINSRQGQREYRFGGRVRIRIQPVTDLGEDQVRIHSQINPEVDPPSVAVRSACLELLPELRQWPLREELTVIGRDNACDVSLDLPLIQQNRLVSSRHAYIRHEGGQFRLFDGSPEGKASVNGTFVNGRRVPSTGHALQEGDVIILAALDPSQPRVDTPGVAAFRFKIVNCPQGAFGSEL